MKNWMKVTPLMLLLALNFSPLSAQDRDELEYEITEGKIAAAEAMMIEDLIKEVESKQQKASSLIALLGDSLNTRYSDEAQKEEAQYAHSGFIARLQGIREDQEAMARKEIQPDIATLQNYSKRLDTLISDLKLFLK